MNTPGRLSMSGALAGFAAAVCLTTAGCMSYPAADDIYLRHAVMGPLPAGLASLPGVPACFWTPDLRAWTMLNGSTILVKVGPSEDLYLMKLRTPVPDPQRWKWINFVNRNAPRVTCSNGTYVSLYYELSWVPLQGLPAWREVVAVRAVTPVEASPLLASSDTGWKPEQCELFLSTGTCFLPAQSGGDWEVRIPKSVDSDPP